MSIKIAKTTIEVEDLIKLEELYESMEEKLTYYAKSHKDFSVLFEKYVDDNTLIVKTLYLEEHVN